MIARYARTLQHLRPWQVVGRLLAPLQRRLAARRVPAPPPSLRATPFASGAVPHHDPWNARDAIREGRFCFLNENVLLGRPVDWAAEEQALLWRFTLHYFHYLHLLGPTEQVALCRDWAAANPVGRGVGWHPYPTSLRIANWCRAGLTASDLLESLYQQAAYLSRTVETHIYGNHLLENARALVLAGSYLQGQGEAAQWRAQGLSIYRAELDEQILPDGFHFERSPLYHALMLEGLLDVVHALPDIHPDQARLRSAARDMTAALSGVVHPDGTLALFNDTTHDLAPPPAALRRYAHAVLGEEPPARLSFPDAGYYVLNADDLWMMIDGGAAGPEYLMAHAHADIFSYELSLFGRRFVVDSGVYQYPAGPMRRYVRGTAAHNTVEIDGRDQIECWDAFRVARRDAPCDVVWRDTEAGAVFEGRFEGYRQRLGTEVSHRRRVAVDTTERRMCVEDEVVGTGTHRAESRVHLHPDVQVSQDGRDVLLSRDGHQCRMRVAAGEVRRAQGWYCPRFGVRHRICVLVVATAGGLPLRCRYEFRY